MNGGWRSLTLACFVVGLIWLVVLPWIARRDDVRGMIQHHQDAGIDPSAMFYSDLEHLTYADGLLRRAAPDQNP